MQQWRWIGWVWGIWTLCVSASPIWLGSIEPRPGQAGIPYHAYQLNNGLRVYIHPDHRQPLVHVSVLYQVGSSYEEKGKYGFAHLFEHMMFQGSRHVSPNEHMKRVYEMGGKINGTTGRDLTHFFQTVPSAYLETVLWLESDRMGFFVDGITDHQFAIQRQVVKSERAEHYDTQPYGLLPETIAQTVYGDGHPYSWIPIGSMADLDQSTTDDLRSFFNTWYGPSNAVLVMAGDVNPERAIEMVDRYFSGIPNGPTHPIRRPWVPLLTHSTHASYTDEKATRPRITMVFPTVPAWHPDEAYLDAIAHTLGNGAAARLHPFIKRQRASDLSVYHATAALSGEFHVVITPYENEDIPSLITDIEAVIDGLADAPLKEEELARYHRQYQMRVADTLSTLEGVASYLGTAHWLTGTADFAPIEWAMNTHLTTANAKAVAQRYLVNKPRVYV
ncbi:insulinase family protein, partial [bacterium]|nr:insulinase family protein [bacterium]